MIFKERLWNTAFSLAEAAIHNFYYLPTHRKLYKKYFPNAKRTFDEMYKSSSIIFSNTHVSASTVRPSMPNVVEIAGIHMKPAQPLPADIQEFLDSATDGAILFSMGSFIQSKMWPVEKRDALVRAFGKLKMKVLWKYENETLPGNPGNIKIGAWIPQRDIVAHKNVKLFITHGGLLGTTEALVEGVPVLGLPIFGDQKMNAAKAVSRGYGQLIYFDDITEERVTAALDELLSNPSYKKNAVDISKRFNDRPRTPKESVVYWTEFVARHDGAHHLKAQAQNLNFIEFHMIDVYGTLAVIALVVAYLNFLVLRAILRRIFRKKPVEVKKKKN
jgi:UDP:flavonoid glycosyltransferase YjiC (YdhE family)